MVILPDTSTPLRLEYASNLMSLFLVFVSTMLPNAKRHSAVPCIFSTDLKPPTTAHEKTSSTNNSPVPSTDWRYRCCSNDDRSLNDCPITFPRPPEVPGGEEVRQQG